MLAAARANDGAALQLQREALVLACSIGDQRRIMACLEHSALAVAASDPGTAVRLFGAAASLRLLAGTPSMGPDRTAIEVCLVGLQQAMAENFAVVWASGADDPQQVLATLLDESGHTSVLQST